jgi:serine acetyltransferase
MQTRLLGAWRQLVYLRGEVARMVNRKWWRWLSCWFSAGFWVLASYRLSRAAYLLLGEGYAAVRIVLGPLLFLVRPWLGPHEIHYRADIGPGLIVLHPALGVVVSQATVAGRNLVLTGGNCIGARGPVRHGDIVLGDDVALGANAVVLGPIRLGNNVRVGAGAVVVRDAADNAILIGVPATTVGGRVATSGEGAR